MVFSCLKEKVVYSVVFQASVCYFQAYKNNSPPPHKSFKPPSNPPPLLKICNYSTPYCTSIVQLWLMASLVIRFFSSLIPSNQWTNFCNFATKGNKIARTVGFPGNFVYKPGLRTRSNFCWSSTYFSKS